MLMEAAVWHTKVGHYGHPPMRATNFEFRFRFFVLVAIFFVGFELRLGHSRLIVAQSLAMITGHSTPRLIQAFICAGAAVVALAAAIRTWATAYLKADVVHDMALHSDSIVADGPYCYVRNPLYLGCILMVVGIGVLARFPNWIFLIVVTTFFCLRLILREEDALAHSQPDSYRAFQRAVPRLIPSLRPLLPPSGRAPKWLQAWGAESFFWVFALAQFYFALTFDYKVFATAIGGTLATYAIAQTVNSLLRKRQVA